MKPCQRFSEKPNFASLRVPAYLALGASNWRTRMKSLILSTKIFADWANSAARQRLIVAQVSKPADLSGPGDGERDCLSEAKARSAGPSERERVSQSPISKSARRA